MLSQILWFWQSSIFSRPIPSSVGEIYPTPCWNWSTGRLSNVSSILLSLKVKCDLRVHLSTESSRSSNHISSSLINLCFILNINYVWEPHDVLAMNIPGRMIIFLIYYTFFWDCWVRRKENISSNWRPSLNSYNWKDFANGTQELGGDILS